MSGLTAGECLSPYRRLGACQPRPGQGHARARADAGVLTWPLLARSGLAARVPAPPGFILVALEQRNPIAPLLFKQPLQVLARARRRLPAQRCLRHGSLRQAPGRAYTNDARRAGAEAAARPAQWTLTTSRMTPTTRCAAPALCLRRAHSLLNRNLLTGNDS